MKPTLKTHVDIEKYEDFKPVHVQSVLPAQVRDALMAKAETTSIKDALLKAVFHYLKCDQNDEKK